MSYVCVITGGRCFPAHDERRADILYDGGAIAAAMVMKDQAADK